MNSGFTSCCTYERREDGFHKGGFRLELGRAMDERNAFEDELAAFVNRRQDAPPTRQGRGMPQRRNGSRPLACWHAASAPTTKVLVQSFTFCASATR